MTPGRRVLGMEIEVFASERAPAVPVVLLLRVMARSIIRRFCGESPTASGIGNFEKRSVDEYLSL